MMTAGIRDELIAKGKCPQCESTKFKNDDLLPNINLRQAIDRFLEAQMTTSGASDSFYKQHQLPGMFKTTLKFVFRFIPGAFFLQSIFYFIFKKLVYTP